MLIVDSVLHDLSVGFSYATSDFASTVQVFGRQMFNCNRENFEVYGSTKNSFGVTKDLNGSLPARLLVLTQTRSRVRGGQKAFTFPVYGFGVTPLISGMACRVVYRAAAAGWVRFRLSRAKNTKMLAHSFSLRRRQDW